MTDGDYTVLTLECAAEEAEQVAETIRESLGMEPVEISRPARDIRWLELYFPGDTEALVAQQALEGMLNLRASSLRICHARDWQSFWQEHFKPVRIGRRLHIIPEWEAEQAGEPDTIPILIRPGLSFGTGDHFTTRFCLESLEALVDAYGPQSMMDAGTGSGILAIVAALLGCPEPYGFDNDEQAVRQARENATLNRVGEQVRLETLDLTTEGVSGSCPLVCANLYFGLLTGFAPVLAGAASRFLVLSGIREHEADAVAQLYAGLGFGEQTRDGDGEWCGLILIREEKE